MSVHNEIAAVFRWFLRALSASFVASVGGGVTYYLHLVNSPGFVWNASGHSLVLGVIYLMFGFLPLLFRCRKRLSFLESRYFVLWGGFTACLHRGWIYLIMFTEGEPAVVLVHSMLFLPIAFFVLLPLAWSLASARPSTGSGSLALWMVLFLGLATVTALAPCLASHGDWDFPEVATFTLGALEGFLAAFLFQLFGGPRAFAAWIGRPRG